VIDLVPIFIQKFGHVPDTSGFSSLIENIKQYGDATEAESVERLQNNAGSKIAVPAFHQDNPVKAGFSISTALGEEIVSSLKGFRELAVLSVMSLLSINSCQ
jgi:hypothetical protein